MITKRSAEKKQAAASKASPPAPRKVSAEPETREKARQAWKQHPGRMSLGFIILLVFLGYYFLQNLILLLAGFTGQEVLLFGFFMGKTAGLVLVLVNTVVFGLLLYGLFKRKLWTRILGMVYFGLVALQAFFSILKIAFSPEEVIQFIVTQTPPEVLARADIGVNLVGSIILYVLQIGVSLLIILFYKKKKGFFATKQAS